MAVIPPSWIKDKVAIKIEPPNNWNKKVERILTKICPAAILLNNLKPNEADLAK